MSEIDLTQLLDEKKKLEESLKNLNHKIDEQKESKTFGKYFSSWTAEEMTMEKLKQKFGVELYEFYQKERNNINYIKNYTRIWKEEKASSIPNIILAMVNLILENNQKNTTKTYVVDGKLLSFYDDEKKLQKSQKKKWETWLEQHQSETGIFSKGNPLVFISSYLSIIPLNGFDYCVQANDGNPTVKPKISNSNQTILSEKVPNSMIPEDCAAINDNLNEDDFKKMLECYPLFEKYDVDVKNFYLDKRYLKHERKTIEDHHVEFWDQDIPTEIPKHSSHSERLFSTHSRNAFEQWATWENLQKVEVYLVSTHPTCKICMVELKNFFEKVFAKKGELFEFSLVCFSTDKKNQKEEFEKIKKNDHPKTNFKFHQILVNQE
jgi:hypothetical protein